MSRNVLGSIKGLGGIAGRGELQGEVGTLAWLGAG